MSEKWNSPEIDPFNAGTRPRRRPWGVAICALAATLTALTGNYYLSHESSYGSRIQRVPLNSQQILAKCAALKSVPGPPTNFLAREISDRFEPGTKPTLIQNATIWTGGRNGTEIVFGDILLDGGVVRGVGKIPDDGIASLRANFDLQEVNAMGGWITPGLVDLHSHLGLASAPLMAGSSEVVSPNGPILPYLRSIDGFNTHDEAFQLAIAGGVTTVQALPGSENAIGGQAFMVKLRKTSDRSPSSMLLEPPHSFNGSAPDFASPPRWRHMKQALGENLRGFGTRMDSIWAFRSAYHEAREFKSVQDAFCQTAESGLWESLSGDFPDDLHLEMLVDVLRGKVKISTHVYEAVDLDDLVRLSNEFQFPLASVHHAAEAWLVPDVLKRAWGGPPAVALFATSARYKREAYRGSEFAPRVLADNNISVIMKSDHPFINSRYLIHEAQQAHYFGLPPHLALASVTTESATAAGLDHRIGLLAEGTDADVVLWDSHPLQIGATPVKVWIDGIIQIPVPPKKGQQGGGVTVGKGKEDREWKQVPRVPNWDEEREKAVEWEGLPPLEGQQVADKVVFMNVRDVWTNGQDGSIETLYSSEHQGTSGVVLVESGRITCAGTATTCLPVPHISDHTLVDLRGGAISPGLMSFGSPLGLQEINGEPSTGDGTYYNPFLEDTPKILGDVGGVLKAVDALQFGTRNALIAHRSGVTVATVSLFEKDIVFGRHNSIISGLSTVFRTGAPHALKRGAVVQNIAALHVVVGRLEPLASGSGKSGASVSEQIATLRRLLFGFEPQDTETGRWFKQAIEGEVPLVIEVDNADIMATLLNLKAEAQDRWGTTMRMVFSGASEAHMLAKEIAEAGVGVILSPPRPYPAVWDQRRILAGPPLTNDTALVKLIENGVTVGLGVPEASAARNVRFDLAWAMAESNGRIDGQKAHALASTNLEKLLGVINLIPDLVAYEGGDAFNLSSKVVAVLSSDRGIVDLM